MRRARAKTDYEEHRTACPTPANKAGSRERRKKYKQRHAGKTTATAYRVKHHLPYDEPVESGEP